MRAPHRVPRSASIRSQWRSIGNNEDGVEAVVSLVENRIVKRKARRLLGPVNWARQASAARHLAAVAKPVQHFRHTPFAPFGAKGVAMGRGRCEQIRSEVSEADRKDPPDAREASFFEPSAEVAVRRNYANRALPATGFRNSMGMKNVSSP